jgi:hypothetical protein
MHILLRPLENLMRSRLLCIPFAVLLCFLSTLAAAVTPVYVVGIAPNAKIGASQATQPAPAANSVGAVPVYVVGSAPSVPSLAHSLAPAKLTETMGQDAVSYNYQVSIRGPKHSVFEATMSVGASALHNILSSTQEATYVKSVECCFKNPKTGKKDVTRVVPGVYTTGISMDMALLAHNPNNLRVAIDLRTGTALRTVTDQANGMSVQLPSVGVESLNTTVHLDKKGRASFKLGEKTVTIADLSNPANHVLLTADFQTVSMTFR